MTSAGRARSLAATGTASILLLIAAGAWIGTLLFGRDPAFPPGWYAPVDPGYLAGATLTLLMWSLGGLVVLLPFKAMALAGLIAAIFWRLKSISWRHLLLAAPLLPSFPLLAWGAYWQSQNSNPVIQRAADCWQMHVLESLMFTGWAIGLVVLATAILSPRWKGQRLFVVGVLLIEFAYYFSCGLVAAMPIENVWL